MKQIFSAVLAAIFVVTSVTLPSLPAQAATLNLRALGQAISVAGEKLSIKFGAKEGEGIVIQVANKEGKVLKNITVKGGSVEEVEQVKPSKLKETLENLKDEAADDASQAGSAATTEQKKANLARRILNLAGHELVQFPVQSFGFFLAIGATVAEQAIFHYADDPIAFEHFIQGQVDPVGQVGFYMFMLANSGASKPLMSMVEKGKINPRLAGFIPYLGMSLGMIASNITSEVGHSEGMKACVAQIMGKKTTTDADTNKDMNACDQAYAKWTGKDGFWASLGRTAMDWTPSLSSLVVTTLVTTAIQSGAMKLADRFLTMTAIDVATFFIPGGGGFVVKAFKAVGFVANFWLFTRVNNVIDPFFTMLIENWRQGRNLSQIEMNLVKNISDLKNPNWKSQELANNLNELTEKMQAWRGMNSTDINTAQSAWIENLNNFAGLYNASKGFYTNVISELSNIQQYGSGYESHLMRTYPLNGIVPTNFNKKEPNTFFTQPNDIRDMQLETVHAASAKLDQMYANNQAFLSTLSSDGRETLLGILKALRSADPQQVGKAMDRMNAELDAKNDFVGARLFQDGETLKALQTVKSMLGFPYPIWEKARGYTYYFIETSEMKDSASLSYFCSFPVSTGIRVVNLCAGTLADWLMASPMWGPDTSKDESVLGVTNGFYAKFLAPRLPMVKDADKDLLFCGKDEHVPMGQATLCRGATEKYDNPLAFVAEHIDPVILEKGMFPLWWKTYAENPYVKTWVDFENKYQPIVAKLIDRMWRSDQAFTNESDIANGLFESAVQEINVNSFILGSLIRIRLEQNGQQAYLQKLLSLNHPNHAIKVVFSDKPTLMKTLMQNNLDMDSVVQSQRYSSSTKASYNFIWQNYLLTQLSQYEDLLRQIKVQQVKLATGQTLNVASSQITNDQLADQQAKVEQAIDYAKTVVDVSRLTNEQAQIADLCLNNMKNVIEQVTTLAKVANAVSYREFVNGGGKLAKQRCTAQHKVGNGTQFSRVSAEGCDN